MEVAGLAFGVAGLAGLFSACVDVLEKVDSLRDSSVTSRSAAAQLKADKHLLERWGRDVGIQGNTLLPSHHPSLSDPAIADAVADVLRSVSELCTKLDSSLEAPLSPVTVAGNQAGLPGKSNNSALARVSWAIRGQARAKSNLEQLGELINRLFELVSVPDADIKKLLEELQAQRDSESRKVVKEWLEAPWTTDIYNISRHKRLANTCQWILEREFTIKWLSNDFQHDSPKILWINGPAGYGKTVLCAKIVEHLCSSPNQQLVAHYFVSADSSTRDKPFEVIKSWLFQLISQNPVALDAARECWDAKAAPRASQDEVVKALKHVLRSLNGCTLIADGLDECGWPNSAKVFDDDKYDRNSAVGFFGAIAEAASRTRTRILLVSRKETYLKRAFDSQLALSEDIASTEYSILPSDINTDAKALSHEIVDRKLPNKSNEQRSELVERMLAKSQGMLLWIRMLEGDLSGVKSTRALLRAVEQAPTALDRLYDNNWNRITSGRTEKKAFSVLRWVAFATRPLTVLELTEALTIPENDADDLDDDDLPDNIDELYIWECIVRLCESLVEVRSQEQPTELNARFSTVHLVHFTVYEYLINRLPVDDGLRPADRRLANRHVAHKRHLTIQCLRYLGMGRALEEGLQLGDATVPRVFIHVAVNAISPCSRRPDAAAMHPTIAGMINRLIDLRLATWSYLQQHIKKTKSRP